MITFRDAIAGFVMLGFAYAIYAWAEIGSAAVMAGRLAW